MKQVTAETEFATRASIVNLENQLIAATEQRDAADKLSMAVVQRGVAGVKADPAEGEDGELYEAMGYVRKSERSSGLHRSVAPVPPTTGT